MKDMALRLLRILAILLLSGGAESGDPLANARTDSGNAAGVQAIRLATGLTGMRHEAVPTGSLEHLFERSPRDLLYRRGTSRTDGGGGVNGAPAPEVKAGLSTSSGRARP